MAEGHSFSFLPSSFSPKVLRFNYGHPIIEDKVIERRVFTLGSSSCGGRDMKFDPNHQPYASERLTLGAANGVVATGNPLAAQAGLEMLKKGGNAVDAAIAAAACLTVVEPTANGIGSDNFALVWMKEKLYGMNANGPSPASISLKEIQKNHEKMPVHGWTPVTVPGAPEGWASLSERFGNLSLLECLTPAIDYAEKGFPVGAHTALMWQRALKKYQEIFQGKPEYEEWFKTFTFDGKAPEPFQVIKLPHHGKTLRLIGETNGRAFYEGVLAEAMEEDALAHGGYLRKSDLASFKASFVTPLSVDYRGFEVVELPPSGQGMVALMALNIFKNFSVEDRDATYYHRMFESMKMAFADGMHYITDPAQMKASPEALLKEAYGKMRSLEIEETAKIFTHEDPAKSGTVYLNTADKEGNMVSMIQSNYMGFGSGIVVKDTGISLQNRGADFSLDENHVNVLAPKKKTYHTIIPGMLLKEGKALAVFGVMGGYMQPQGHFQVVSNLIDFHLNPQMALDAPRWQWIKEKAFMVEPAFDQEALEALREKGHEVKIEKDRSHFGRGQIIVKLENAAYAAGCESRTDSNLAVY